MRIERLRVQNFRSFREIDIQLPAWGAVVGANASGKSNFVQVFRFLRDVVSEGFENAISLQGGVDYLRNMRIGAHMPLQVELSAIVPLPSSESRPPVEARLDYSLEIRFAKRGRQYKVAREECRLEPVDPHPDASLLALHGVRRENTIKWLHLPKVVRGFRSGTPLSSKEPIPADTSILRIYWGFLQVLWGRTSPLVEIYDFDPKLMKRAVPLGGRAVLEEDGSNLPVVLREILSHKETRHELLTLLGRFLPFVSNMGVQNMVDRSVLLQLYERYLPDQPIPSMLLSDGTVQLVALIVALWVAPASRRSVVIAEEPDRNLHPHLIEQLVALFREISDRRQILFTTHNPEVVRHTPVENLLLVSRDKEGFSVISRPASNEQVQHFLKGEMGLDELFVENLLGA